MDNKEVIKSLQAVISIMDTRLSVKGLENVVALSDCAKILIKTCAKLNEESQLNKNKDLENK